MTITTVGFDADDTLWHNERSYRDARDRFGRLLAAAGVRLDAAAIDASIHQTEMANLSYYGYGVSRVAYQNGLNDGYEKGLDDARDRKYPDLHRQKWYRSGDRHYESRYGSKDAYKDQYRRGFEEGYQRAYRDGSRGARR